MLSDTPVHPATRSFRFGDWLVQPSLNTLSRGETVLRIRPKVMDVLVLLAEHAGEVLSKDAIIDTVWAKKFLADTALSRAIFELREALGDEAHGPKYIETVPKRGYRLVAPVTPVAEPERTDGRPEKVAPRAPGWWPAVAVGGFILVAVSVWLLVGMRPSGPQPPTTGQTRRIVVLPFENLGAPEDDYLAAGLTDVISGRLAAVPGLAIISQSTARQYTKVGKGAKEIGRELGVHYLVEGGIQWNRGKGAGSGVRITPRLVRTADATQVWAEVYDHDMQDVFEVQSEIARRVIEAVGLTVVEPERLGLAERPTANVEAYQEYLRGLYYSDQVSFREQRLRLALGHLRRAAELDPAFGVAHAEVARMRAALYQLGFDPSSANRTEAQRELDLALRLAPDEPRVHLSLGLYLSWCQRDFHHALEELSVARRGLGETSELLQAEGWVLGAMGRWEEALDRYRRAGDLNPRGWGPLADAGRTSMFLRRYGEGRQLLERAIALAPDEGPLYASLAEVHWCSDGDTAGARQVLQGMPGSAQSSETFHWFWQEVFEGRYQPALDRVPTASAFVFEDDFIWEPSELLRARAYSFLGRLEEAHRAFENSCALAERSLRENPDDFRILDALAVSLAGVGRKHDAIETAKRAAKIFPPSKGAIKGYEPVLTLAHVYTMVGEHDLACAQLDTLLSVPFPISVPLLKLDPTWTSLRGQPCFAALVAGHKR